MLRLTLLSDQVQHDSCSLQHQRQHTLHVLWGVWVFRSQNLSVVSPLPLASWRPSGLNAVAKTASV